MENLDGIFLLNMLWIGPIQLILAVRGAEISKHPFRRRHFEFYLNGVIAYLVGNVIALAVCQGGSNYLLFRWTFFGGAVLLFLYHIAIATGFLGAIFLRKRSL
jgi:hypothetical protein